MQASRLAPWAIAAGAVAFASMRGPPSDPAARPPTLAAPIAHEPLVAQIDERALAGIVDRAVRDALAAQAAEGPRAAPEHPTRADRFDPDAREDGLAVVSDVVALGSPTLEHRAALRAALSRADQAGGDAILSAWVTAINVGDIRIPPGEPPL